MACLFVIFAWLQRSGTEPQCLRCLPVEINLLCFPRILWPFPLDFIHCKHNNNILPLVITVVVEDSWVPTAWQILNELRYSSHSLNSPGQLLRISVFFVLFCLFVCLFLAVLGLRFCARAFSSCGERGPLFIAVRGPLTIAASLVAEHRIQTRRLSSCGSRAQLLRGMWDLPEPGLEPVSPALAGGFSTTAPPGKPPEYLFYT